MVILDATREIKAPFSPADAGAEFALMFKNYGIKRIFGDRYAGQYRVEDFAMYGLRAWASAAADAIRAIAAASPIANAVAGE